MGKSDIKTGPAPQGGLRPSLLQPGASAAEHNILDVMDSRATNAPAAARPQRRVLWLLPLLAAALWGVWSQVRQPPAEPVPTPLAQIQSAAPPPRMPAEPVGPSADSDPVAKPANDTPPAPPAKSPVTPGTPFEALAIDATQARPDSQTNPLVALQERPDTPAAVLTTPQKPAGSANKAKIAERDTRQSTASAKPKPHTQAATSKPAAPARKPAPPATRNAAATKGNDPDAELIGAIMKHLGSGATAIPANTPARSAQTIADLVRSCQGKDAIEALLCQRRICEGSWGKAQACPMSKAPQAIKASAAP